MIPKPKILPYYGKPSLMRSLTYAKVIRNENKFLYFFKRLINHILLQIAYSCPINSIRIKLHKLRGVKIGNDVFIGLQVIIDRSFPDYVIIEDNVMIAGGNHLLTHSRAPEYFKGKLLSYVAPIVIKKNAWLGINSIILPGVTIGEGSIVTAGSVVTSDIPPNVVVQGNPAKIIRELTK